MKEKETFSPGPWHVYEGPLNNDIFRRGRTVCTGEAKYRHVVAFCNYHWPKRAEANAHLIAEAPQMLAILKELIRLECDLPPVLLRRIVVAIARAEGVKRMPRAGKVASATMARNHIGVLQKDTSDRVDNEIDQHVKVPLRDIDANRQWSQQNADTHSIAGRTISAHRAISRSTRPSRALGKGRGART